MKWFAGFVVLALGVAGLIRGAVAQSSTSSSGAGSVVGVGAQVRQLSASTASVTMTVYNTTGAADRITGAQSGAGAQATVPSLVVPAHGSVSLIGSRKIIISKLYSPLRAGQYVSVSLSLQTAGSVLVTARVVASTGSSGSVAPSSPSGVHS